VRIDKKKKRETKTCETISLPHSIESNGIVYDDGYKQIEKITAQFDSFNKEYFVSDFGEKAALLVFNNNHILLTRQYRLLINDLSYEVPGGKVDKGEHPEQTAIRECFEETGIRCSDLKPLIAYDPDLEYTRNHTHVFYSHDTENAKTQLSEKHKWLPFNDCLEMIEQGIITDSLSIITIFAYKVKKEKI
jgi:8-oxo-dGTP pyrophosphatase MutT (NUDIX family)